MATTPKLKFGVEVTGKQLDDLMKDIKTLANQVRRSSTNITNSTADIKEGLNSLKSTSRTVAGAINKNFATIQTSITKVANHTTKQLEKITKAGIAETKKLERQVVKNAEKIEKSFQGISKATAEAKRDIQAAAKEIKASAEKMGKDAVSFGKGLKDSLASIEKKIDDVLKSIQSMAKSAKTASSSAARALEAHEKAQKRLARTTVNETKVMQRAYRQQSQAVESLFRAPSYQSLSIGSVLRQRRAFTSFMKDVGSQTKGSASGMPGLFPAGKNLQGEWMQMPFGKMGSQQMQQFARKEQITFTQAISHAERLKLKYGQLKEPLTALGRKMSDAGKQARWLGQNLSFSLSLPLLAGARRAVQLYMSVAQEITRIQKVGNIKVNTPQGERQMQNIRAGIADLVTKFGVSQKSASALTGDIVAMGYEIRGVNSEANQMAEQIMYTATLGDIGIKTATDFYRTMLKVFVSGQPGVAGFKDEIAGTNFIVDQLNQIENKTAINLNQLADAMPVAAGAAKLFGLSAGELASTLTGLYDRGIAIKTAATGLNFTFTRILSPTKKAAEVFDKAFGVGALQGVQNIGNGMERLIKLSEMYRYLLQTQGKVAATQVFSELVSKRQIKTFVPTVESINTGMDQVRMAIQNNSQAMQMAASKGIDIQQASYKELIPIMQEYGKELLKDEVLTQGFIRGLIASNGWATITSDNIEKLSKRLKDLSAQEIAIKLKSDPIKYQVLMQTVKMLGAEIGRVLFPYLIRLSNILIKVLTWFDNLSEQIKQATVAVLGLIAALGPIVVLFGSIKTFAGIVTTVIATLLPGFKTLSGATATMLHNMGMLNAELGSLIMMSEDRFIWLNKEGRIASFFAKLFGFRKADLLATNAQTAAEERLASARMGSASSGAMPFKSFSGIQRNQMLFGRNIGPTKWAAGAAKYLQGPLSEPLTAAPKAATLRQTLGATQAGAATTSALQTTRQRIKSFFGATDSGIASPVTRRMLADPDFAASQAAAGRMPVGYRLFGRKGQDPFARALESINQIGTGSLGIPIGDRRAMIQALMEAGVTPPRVDIPEIPYTEETVTEGPRRKRGKSSRVGTGRRVSGAAFNQPRSRTIKVFKPTGLGRPEVQFAQALADVQSAMDLNARDLQAYMTDHRKQYIRELIAFKQQGLLTKKSIKKILAGDLSSLTQLAAKNAQAKQLLTAMTTTPEMIAPTTTLARGKLRGQLKRVISGRALGQGAEATITGPVGRQLEALIADPSFMPGTRIKATTKAMQPAVRRTMMSPLRGMAKGYTQIFGALASPFRAMVTQVVEDEKGKSVRVMRGSKAAKSVAGKLSKVSANVSSLMSSTIDAATSGFARETGTKSLGTAVKTVGVKSTIKGGAKGAMGGFANLFTGGAKGVLGILKPLASMGTIFGQFTVFLPLIIAVGVAIFGIIKNWDEVYKGLKPGIDAIKKAWEQLLNAFKGVGKIFTDAFGSLSSESNKAAADNKSIWESIGVVIGGIITIFSKLVIVIAKAITALAPVFRWIADLVTGQMGVIINIIKAVAALFTGDASNAVQYLRLAFASFFKFVISAMRPFLAVISMMFRSIAKLASGIAGIFGAKGIQKRIQNFAQSFNLEKSLKNWIDTKIGGIQAEVEIKPTFFGENDYDARSRRRTSQVTKGDEADIPSDEDQNTDATQGTADKMASIWDNFLSTLKSKLEETINELKNTLDKSFNKIWEDRLKVYDDQIKAIDDLEKKEEELLATQEYLQSRRDALNKRSLDQQNYVRNRALAVYEGRIDDARMLDLEFSQTNTANNKAIADLDSARARDLLKKQRDIQRQQIQEAKSAAEELRKVQEENLKKQIDLITQYTPRTDAEWRAMMDQINNTIAAYGMPMITGSFMDGMQVFKTASDNAKMEILASGFWNGEWVDTAVLGWISRMSGVPLQNLIKAAQDAAGAVSGAIAGVDAGEEDGGGAYPEGGGRTPDGAAVGPSKPKVKDSVRYKLADMLSGKASDMASKWANFTPEEKRYLSDQGTFAHYQRLVLNATPAPLTPAGTPMAAKDMMYQSVKDRDNARLQEAAKKRQAFIDRTNRRITMPVTKGDLKLRQNYDAFMRQGGTTEEFFNRMKEASIYNFIEETPDTVTPAERRMGRKSIGAKKDAIETARANLEKVRAQKRKYEEDMRAQGKKPVKGLYRNAIEKAKEEIAQSKVDLIQAQDREFFRLNPVDKSKLGPGKTDKGFLGNFVDDIKNLFNPTRIYDEKMKQKAKKTGSDLAAGIAEGAKDTKATKQMGDNLKASVDKANTAVKKDNEIASPSRRFGREVGQPITLGIAAGILNEKVVAVLKESFETLLRPLLNVQRKGKIYIDFDVTTGGIRSGIEQRLNEIFGTEIRFKTPRFLIDIDKIFKSLTAGVRAYVKFLDLGIGRPNNGPNVSMLESYLGSPIPGLATGGIVKSRPGGIMANIGEGRYDEAVIPLPNGLKNFANSFQPAAASMGRFEGSMKTAMVSALKECAPYMGGEESGGVTIYVDNFIGQPQWFESMMAEYGVKVAPNKQRSYGTMNRKVTSYQDNAYRTGRI